MEVYENTIKTYRFLRRKLDLQRKDGDRRVHARIRVMNYHKELKKAGNALFSVTYKGIVAFETKSLKISFFEMIENFIPKTQKTVCFEPNGFDRSFGSLFCLFLTKNLSNYFTCRKQKFWGL